MDCEVRLDLGLTNRTVAHGALSGEMKPQSRVGIVETRHGTFCGCLDVHRRTSFPGNEMSETFGTPYLGDDHSVPIPDKSGLDRRVETLSECDKLRLIETKLVTLKRQGRGSAEAYLGRGFPAEGQATLNADDACQATEDRRRAAAEEFAKSVASDIVLP